jgi:hypothetical protein
MSEGEKKENKDIELPKNELELVRAQLKETLEANKILETEKIDSENRRTLAKNRMKEVIKQLQRENVIGDARYKLRLELDDLIKEL